MRARGGKFKFSSVGDAPSVHRRLLSSPSPPVARAAGTDVANLSDVTDVRYSHYGGSRHAVLVAPKKSLLPRGGTSLKIASASRVEFFKCKLRVDLRVIIDLHQN